MTESKRIHLDRPTFSPNVPRAKKSKPSDGSVTLTREERNLIDPLIVEALRPLAKPAGIDRNGNYVYSDLEEVRAKALQALLEKIRGS